MLGLWSAGREYAVQDLHGRLRADCSGGTGGLFGRLLVLEQSVSGALHHVSPVTSSQRECISISSLSAASPQPAKSRAKASKDPARWRKEPADKE